jgi:hypothetical protein
LLVSSSHFAPRSAGATRHVNPALVDTPTFERDVIAIALEEPVLIAEYATRIPPDRFGDPVCRRIYDRLWEEAGSLVQPADVFALFSDDGDVSATLASIAGAERSKIVRFPDSDARRAFLDRLLDRFAADDQERRVAELKAQINDLFEAGLPVPSELIAEEQSLRATRAKLKG